MKKLCVVIPSYNHGKFLKKAIDSVLNQTYKDFELIILDDASIDNSKKIIESYKDPRITKYYNSENQGAVATLNQLIEFADSEYIALLNSDDYWEPTKLQKQIEYLDKHDGKAACFTLADFVDEENNLILESNRYNINIFNQMNRKQSEWYRYFFDNGNCLCHPSVMIRKEVYLKIGKYKKTYKQLPDFEFWVRLIKEYDIHIIQENLTHFRILNSENKNTSFLSDKSFNLIIYEAFNIKNEFFNNCSYSLFYEAFKDKLLEKIDKNDLVSFEYEKALIQYNCPYHSQLGRLIAYKDMGRLFENERYFNIISKKYNISMNDYYKMGQKIVPLEEVIFEQKTIETVKMPVYMQNSRYYKLCNFIYRNKITGKILKLFRRN